MFNECDKIYTKLESVTKEYFYNYLSSNNMLHKYIWLSDDVEIFYFYQ